jgi:hypothetical protein
VISKSGALLVLTVGLEQDHEFVLNKTLPRLQVAYRRVQSSSGQYYQCEFEWQPVAALNVAVPIFHFEPPPNTTILPPIRTYENTTLLDILSSVSVELYRAWSCGRLWPSYVKRQNQNLVKRQITTTWWPKQDAPCYSVVWERGAFHGEDVETKEQLAKENQERWARFREIERARSRGWKNMEKSPLRLQVTVDAQTSTKPNVWLTLSLTNTSDQAYSLPNPYLSDLASAFWDIRAINDDEGQYGEYELILPIPDNLKEPTEITVAPLQSLEWRLNIWGATMLLDETTIGPDFRGDRVKKLEHSGHYMLRTGLYIKDRSGDEFYILQPLVEFEMRP